MWIPYLARRLSVRPAKVSNGRTVDGYRGGSPKTWDWRIAVGKQCPDWRTDTNAGSRLLLLLLTAVVVRDEDEDAGDRNSDSLDAVQR